MCGRYTQTREPWEFSDTALAWKPPEPDFWVPRYNIAPSQLGWVVPNEEERAVRAYRWGLIPPWAKDASFGNRTINARAETLHEKAAFKDAFSRRRCLVLADGFYEWKREGKRKVPHCIRMKSGEPFVFAGLWDRWKSPEGEWVRSFTIITTEANALMAPVHHRMPVILGPEAYERWLDPKPVDTERVRQLLQPFDPERMEIYPVSELVNSPDNDAPELLLPRKAAPGDQTSLFGD